MKRAVEELEASGILAGAQAELLRRVYGRRLLSVHWELRALLYAGILVLVLGLGLWIRQHLTALGHALLLGGIAAGALACFGACARRGGGFSADEVPSPSPAFDYVLFLGCLLVATDLTYLELRYRLLGGAWNLYLLGSGALYLLLAHRFDNRLVLSLALSTLGAWMGVKASLLAPESLSQVARADALLFGGLVVAAGAGQTVLGWKPHFLPVHLHLGANLVLAALLSGVFEGRQPGTYALLTLAVAACLGGYAVRARRFAYLPYAFGYGYAGLSAYLLDEFDPGERTVMIYFLVTSSAVGWALWTLHRRLRSDT